MTIEKIPDSYRLNDEQCIQRDCIMSGEPYVNQGGILDFLSALRYPLYNLNFETIGPAVPLFNGTHPYQSIPFQFSFHLLNGHAGLAETSYCL